MNVCLMNKIKLKKTLLKISFFRYKTDKENQIYIKTLTDNVFEFERTKISS